MKILVDVNICSDIPTSNEINGYDYMHIWRLPLESKPPLFCSGGFDFIKARLLANVDMIFGV